jgi:hypothetical protein
MFNSAEAIKLYVEDHLTVRVIGERLHVKPKTVTAMLLASHVKLRFGRPKKVEAAPK